ncbi:MAG: hypothetical protein QOG62_2005 [Thermoleophilaceae bacterium]|jgi:hypothetical protein|nr:hypothetical protein [Thermoleophilaceae bacterium]
MTDEPMGVPGDPTGSEASEEEMREAIEEQLRRLRVEDVIIQSVATFMSLAGRRLGLAPGSEGERDLNQARLAIEGARALAVLVPEPDAAAVKDALSQLQMAFVKLAKGDSPAAEPGEAPPPEAAPEPAEADDEAARADARSRIWTPPGT